MNVLYRRFGLYGDTTREFLTYRGRMLWHWNRDELAFLFPIAKRGSVRVREIPPDVPEGLCLHVRDHPEMSWVRWPLDRAQFRNQKGAP